MGKKLYVGNLPYSVTDDSLRELFAAAGEVTDAKVIMDKFSGRSKGFGFVEYATVEDATKGKEGMDGKEIAGRPIKADFARPARKREE